MHELRDEVQVLRRLCDVAGKHPAGENYGSYLPLDLDTHRINPGLAQAATPTHTQIPEMEAQVRPAGALGPTMERMLKEQRVVKTVDSITKIKGKTPPHPIRRPIFSEMPIKAPLIPNKALLSAVSRILVVVVAQVFPSPS